MEINLTTGGRWSPAPIPVSARSSPWPCRGDGRREPRRRSGNGADGRRQDWGQSGDALALDAGFSNAEQVAQMFENIDSAWGGLDVLVNNAGIDGPRAYGWENDPSSWRRVFEIDLLGASHRSREALRRMGPRKSEVILNLTSVHEVMPTSTA